VAAVCGVGLIFAGLAALTRRRYLERKSLEATR
jgi:hypothetical protein